MVLDLAGFTALLTQSWAECYVNLGVEMNGHIKELKLKQLKPRSFVKTCSVF